MGLTGLTLTQPAKTRTHALWVRVKAGLGEGQWQVGYEYNLVQVTPVYP